MQQKYPLVAGSATVSNGAATSQVIAAQGAGKVIRLGRGVLSVVVAATGGGGRISLKDGTNVIMSWDADAIQNIGIVFHESTGYPGTANTAVNLVAEGAGGNQATCFIAINGFVVG
jgi:hypothetical protein